jgi:hypothetical protein
MVVSMNINMDTVFEKIKEGHYCININNDKINWCNKDKCIYNDQIEFFNIKNEILLQKEQNKIFEITLENINIQKNMIKLQQTQISELGKQLAELKTKYYDMNINILFVILIFIFSFIIYS